MPPPVNVLRPSKLVPLVADRTIVLRLKGGHLHIEGQVLDDVPAAKQMLVVALAEVVKAELAALSLERTVHLASGG